MVASKTASLLSGIERLRAIVSENPIHRKLGLREDPSSRQLVNKGNLASPEAQRIGPCKIRNWRGGPMENLMHWCKLLELAPPPVSDPLLIPSILLSFREAN